MNETNQAEEAFWNGDPGLNWVRFQPVLDAHHRLITERLLEACAPRPGEIVLDIGCGAGGSTLELARLVAPSGRVDGLDFSRPLLELAERRRRDAGIANATFAHGEAQGHAFPPGRYDLAASRFGVMFFSDPVAAFRNIAGSLRPGGRLVFVAWAGPEVNPWFTVPVRVATARLGPIETAPPEAPGPMAFRDADRVLGLLEAAGLVAPSAVPYDTHLHHPGGLDSVLDMLGTIGSLPRILRDRPSTPADRAAILEGIRAAFSDYDGPDGLHIPARVTIFAARAPA